MGQLDVPDFIHILAFKFHRQTYPAVGDELSDMIRDLYQHIIRNMQ